MLVSNAEGQDMPRQFYAYGLALVVGVGISMAVVPVSAHGLHHHGQPAQLKRAIIEPHIPSIVLQRDDGAKVDFGTELDRPGPTYLNFIYTSCVTVCPVMSQTFSVLRDRLGPDRGKVRMISLSIDPEYDTPARLAAYRQQFGADSAWRFYTGTLEASVAMQKAFGVLSRDKMNHPVATFYRAAGGHAWVRIDGFVSPEQLESEYRSGGAE